MVDAPERGPDEAQSQEKGNRVKYSKANTLHTQRFIARYGKAARYPVCQAAIRLWGLDADLEEGRKKAEQIEESVNSAKRQKEQVLALYEQFYKEGKQKEVIQVEALLQKINEYLPKLQTGYGAQVAYCLMLCRELRPVAVALFERENDAVVRTKDTKALRALKLVKQRWSANPSGKGARLRAGDQRELEILKMHRDKVIKATLATKDGVGVGYLEAFRGGDRPLSDEVWQGRFTVKDIHSHLLATHGARVAGDKDGKEIRRTMRSLGIRPAEDQRGRKWKPPVPKKQGRKRPGITKLKITRMTEAMLAKTAEQEDGLRNKQIYKAGDERGLKWARQVLKSMDREIAQIAQRRGGRRGKFVY
jgi:hypothetical protein